MPHPPEIKTLSSATVYQNRWMRVREDQILRADGSPGLYGVIEKPDFAVVAAIENGTVYLVEQFRYPIGERSLELPQGASEDEVMDPLTLARAELLQETGLTARHMVHVARMHEAAGYATHALNLFLATGLEQGSAQLESEEQGLVCLPLRVSEALDRCCNGTITDAVTIACFGLLRLKGLV